MGVLSLGISLSGVPMYDLKSLDRLILHHRHMHFLLRTLLNDTCRSLENRKFRIKVTLIVLLGSLDASSSIVLFLTRLQVRPHVFALLNAHWLPLSRVLGVVTRSSELFVADFWIHHLGSRQQPHVWNIEHALAPTLIIALCYVHLGVLKLALDCFVSLEKFHALFLNVIFK